MGMMKEFKEFAMRGNLVDLAVGVVIGGAFGKLTTSFIEGIVMPPIGKLMGNVDFSQLKYVIQPGQAAVKGADGAVTTPEVAEVAIKYGAFINTLIDFIIVAFVMFMVIKAMNRLAKKKADEPKAPAAPPAQEVLLTEIRDLLKEKK